MGGDPTGPNFDIVIVIDDSRSMFLFDPHYERLEAVRAFLNAALEGDRVGLVRFSGTTNVTKLTPIIHKGGSHTDWGMKSLREDLEIDSNLAAGLTPTHFGLITACDELAEHGEMVNRVAILISDGASNVGLDRSINVDPVERCFADRGWTIHTVGIGNYSRDVLGAFADNTGGTARYVPQEEMARLVCEVQAIRSEIAGGGVSSCLELQLLQDHTTDIAVNVPAAQLQATFTLNWIGPDSDVELRLTRPDGKVVAGRAYLPFDDVSFDGGTRSEKTLEAYSIDLPEAGTWGVQIIPKVVPEEGLLVVLGFSSVPAW